MYKTLIHNVLWRRRHAILLLCAALSLSGCDTRIKKDIRNLDHKRVGVRLHAIEALARNRDQRSIRALNGVINDPDTRVRLKAIEVLGVIRDPSSVAPLLTKIDDREQIIRLAAIETLGQLKDPRAIESLSSLLTRPDPNVRVTTITALGEIGSICCIEKISECLNDDDKYIRSAAILALTNIGHPSAIDSLDTGSCQGKSKTDALSSLIVLCFGKPGPWIGKKMNPQIERLSNLVSEIQRRETHRDKTPKHCRDVWKNQSSLEG